MQIILVAIGLLASIVTASSFHEQYDALPDAKKSIVVDYLSFPFKDFVCMPYMQKKRVPYQIALLGRQEFRDVDWHVDSPIDLAKQLWRYQPEERSFTFSMGLNSNLRTLMKKHNIEPRMIEQVVDITSDWVRSVNKKESDRKYVLAEDEERKKLTQARRWRNNTTRRAARREGQCLPLLNYLKIPSPETASADTLLEEALKYQSKYISAPSFQAALRQMYNTLKFDKRDVYFQCRDRRTFHCPSWPERKSNSKLTIDFHQKDGILPTDSVEMAEDGEETTEDQRDPQKGHEWEEFGLDDLELSDIDTSYRHPSASIFSDVDLSSSSFFEPF